MHDAGATDEERAPPQVPDAVPRLRAGSLLARDWDAIVVGAGVGGLSAAVLLARRGGLRVLVLERHYVPGGLTQTFRRRRDEFEVGVHYVGEVGDPSMPLRRVFDALTEGRLGWCPFAEVHDRVRYDGTEVGFGSDRARLRASLLAFSPGEATAIDRYLADVETCRREAPRFLLARAEPRPVDDSRVPFRRFTDITTSEHLRAIGASDRLAGLLSYPFSTYASSPERSSFAAHAAAAGYYLDGASFPIGGGSRIAAEMVRTLTRAGGAVVVCAGVDAIRVQDARVRGVRLEDGTELDAGVVVSDVGLANTAHRLLDDDAPGVERLRDAVRAIGPSLAHCALYLGLSGEPDAHGIERANLWRHDVAPARSEERMAAWVRGEVDAPETFFVSRACACDPSWSARRPGRTSVVALFNAPWAPFAEWADDKRGRRGRGYDALKERLTRQALDAVVGAMPQIAGAIEHVELSTPASTRTFTSHPRGEIAGLDHTPLRFALASSPRTAIEGLAISGQDAWMTGIGGAVFGGVAAASYVLGRDLARELLIARR